MIRFCTYMAAVALIAGCATRPRTYQPPDSKKMDEARQKLSTDVEKASVSAKKVHEHVQAAQTSAGKVVKFSGAIEVKLGQLHGRVTAELRPAVEDIQSDVTAIKSEEGVLTGKLTDATTAEKELTVDLSQAQMDKDSLTKEAATYATNAQKLADNATAERDKRIDAEKKLSWYRWHSWLMKIATGLIILLIVVVAFLWFTGRLAGLAARFL